MANNVFNDTNKRLFYLSDDINNSSIGAMCFNLLCIIQEDDEKDSKEKDYKRQPIKIYINSLGGALYDMWGLIDIIHNSKTPIYTYCTGYAMSAAFIVFISGHKRFISEHATLMYHQYFQCFSGKYQDFVDNRVQDDYLQTQVEQWVLNRTNITQEQLDDIRLHKQDWYIHAYEAIKFGIADEQI